jgi:hypothetical protein
MSPRFIPASLLALLLAWPASAEAAPTPAPAATPAAAPQFDRLVEAPRSTPDERRWSLADLKHGTVGIGLFSVGGHFVRDRQRQGREPLIEPGGRDNRVAAVGLSLRF